MGMAERMVVFRAKVAFALLACLPGCCPSGNGQMLPVPVPPSGGLLKTVDGNIAAALTDKAHADSARTEAKDLEAYVYYAQGLQAATRAFTWSQEFELSREWFAKELYPQLSQAIHLAPSFEESLEAMRQGQYDPMEKRSIALLELRLAYTRLRMNCPVTLSEVELTEKRYGKAWWEKRHDIMAPCIVASRDDAWLAAKERMRLLDLYLKGKGPRPPHVHEIVNDLRRRRVIGKVGESQKKE